MRKARCGAPSRHRSPAPSRPFGTVTARPLVAHARLAMEVAALFARLAPPPRLPSADFSRGRAVRGERAVVVRARRGWGDTDSRFSKLDKKSDGAVREDDYGDTQKNISFQELRKRQDRELRKVRARRAPAAAAASRIVVGFRRSRDVFPPAGRERL